MKAVTILAIAMAATLGPPGRATAQTPSDDGGAESDRRAPVPWAPGERMTYQVKIGMFGEVGTGGLSVVGVDTVRTRPSYHLKLDIDGKVLFARVRDTLQSWVDVADLRALRFHQDTKEFRHERHRYYDFYPERGHYIVRSDKVDEQGRPRQEQHPLASNQPLDDVSFLYLARTLPLEVGTTYSFNRYFKESGNPVVLRVLRKERVTVPAGTFDTVVVQPIIQTDGLFGEGGKAEVYFSDDERRLIVQLKSEVPVLGSLNMFLEGYEVGQPLR